MGKTRWLAAAFVASALAAVAAAVAQQPSAPDPEIPFLDDWKQSAHARIGAEAFRHWDDDGAVPAACARCHTTTGLLDYLGLDGTPMDAVDAAHPPAAGVECTACHNEAARRMDAVRLPSGFVAEGLGRSAICTVCHQGTSSAPALRTRIAALPPDEVSDDIGFTNPHYLAAGPTLFGGAGQGAFQYETRLYAWRMEHPPMVQECGQCHDPHRLEVQPQQCGRCHEGIQAAEDLRQHRFGLNDDYDGDGNVTEGLAAEVEGLRSHLDAAVRAYAGGVAGKAMAVSFGRYPYFFLDNDGDGEVGPDEASYGNRYDAWTPRLVTAAYNLVYATREPGAFAHNPRYILQVLIDSIADLGEASGQVPQGLVRPE